MAVTRRSPLPPSAGTTEASSITRRSSTSELGYIARGGVAPFNRSSRTQVRTHARTRGGGGGAGGPPASYRAPRRVVCVTSVSPRSARMERTETARLAIAHAASRVRTHARANGPVVADVGGMWVVGRCAFGRTRAAARDARDARAACNASARAGTARGVVVCLLLGPLRWARRARAVLSPSYPRFSRVPRNAGVKITGTQPT